MPATSKSWSSLVPHSFVASLLDDLRPREREALGLRYLNRFEVPEIARQLGITPGSVSGHLSKGLENVGRILGAPRSLRRSGGEALLILLGEELERRRPPIDLDLSDAGRVRIHPARYVIGSAIRPDRYVGSELLRYFMSRVGEAKVSEMAFDAWLDSLPMRLGVTIVRTILDGSGIKAGSKFDHEMHRYFFPIGFGYPELFYGRDFDHEPELLLAPDAHGRMVWHRRESTVPSAAPEYRPLYLAPWYMPRVFDLGEYRSVYEDDLVRDALAAGMRG